MCASSAEYSSLRLALRQEVAAVVTVVFGSRVLVSLHALRSDVRARRCVERDSRGSILQPRLHCPGSAIDNLSNAQGWETGEARHGDASCRRTLWWRVPPPVICRRDGLPRRCKGSCGHLRERRRTCVSSRSRCHRIRASWHGGSVANGYLEFRVCGFPDEANLLFLAFRGCL
ncbi:hypothetical protein TGRUB_297647 [Toxoplasma gondii RUB]|uniref:Uncharacterized protein n=1 Tax=Toxoplasma gondii RUB TaxID=935652 RepID=A0A086LXD8_TOXGO|nr:hypothetical protein TGRUB_297647 [Toxoplasma gondii RUB]